MAEAHSYKPLSKGRIFHDACYNPRYDTVLYLGAFGAGKSLALVQQVVDMAMTYPGTRYLVVRKRYTDLRDTTLVTFKESVDPRLYTYNKAEHDATMVNGSVIMFRGLDKMTKVGSIEVAVVAVDELYELSFDEFKMLKARARQKGTPDAIAKKLIAASNPCDIGKNPNGPEWMYIYFHKEPEANPTKYDGRFHVKANSLENPYLPKDYVENLMRDYPPSWVRRFIYGEWGTVPKGDPVFNGFMRDLRKEPWHVDAKMKPIEGIPVLRGWDFGWHHPATVWAQVDPDGRILIHDVMVGNQEYLRQYAPRALSNPLFIGGRWFFSDYADHAGHQVKDSAEKTSIQILEEEFKLKVDTRPAHVSESLEHIQKQLGLVIKGAPGIVYHPRCEVLIAAMEGGYCRIRAIDGNQMGITPYKDGFYEHPMDAKRYIFDGIMRSGGLTNNRPADTMSIAEPGWAYNREEAK